MRVVHVITGLETGGAEMMLQKLTLDHYSSTEHIVVSLRTLGTVGSRLREKGIQVETLNALSWRKMPAALIRLIALLRELEPDVIQGWMYHGNAAAWLSSRFLRRAIPLCWTIRCSIDEPKNEKWTTKLLRKMSRLFCGSVEVIIYNSHRAKAQHEEIGFPQAKGIVIPNGFDTNRFVPSKTNRLRFRKSYGLGDEQSVIGHVARAHPVKDHLTFIKAAVQVAAAIPRAIFILAGRGVPDLGKGSDQIAGLLQTLGSKVILLPEQDCVEDLMSSLDVLVLSSVAEGFPNVLGEALSCGVPCVATDIGDCSAVVGTCGRIVNPRDDLMLASAIGQIVALTPEAWQSLSTKARNRAIECYSIETVAQLYNACWRKADRSREI